MIGPQQEIPLSKRARDYGLVCGTLPPGPLNAITDVPGVAVGHRTLREGDIRTGFTAVLPHGGDLFREKVRAGVDVINGFGKSAGLMQLAELGQIETPLLLGNTFSVAVGIEALVGRALAGNPEIGRSTGTVNGQGSVPLLGFACFFLLQPAVQQGNDSFVFGQFIEGCAANGTPGPNPTAGTGPDIIQLYDDPASNDS